MVTYGRVKKTIIEPQVSERRHWDENKRKKTAQRKNVLSFSFSSCSSTLNEDSARCDMKNLTCT